MSAPRSKSHPFDRYPTLFLMGMSGVGKTRLARRLPRKDWFHYSVDYRIGTMYLAELINDDLKRMVFERDGALSQLLRSDSIYLTHNITFDNLEPISKWLGGLGKATEPNAVPGHRRATTRFFDGLGHDPAIFAARQAVHADAEIAAMLDCPAFIDKARAVYRYPYFIADTSGSVCDVIEMDQAADGTLVARAGDPVLRMMRQQGLLIYIEAPQSHRDALAQRNKDDPKPMFYRPEVLQAIITEYLTVCGLDDPRAIHPASFSQFAFGRLIDKRLARYRAVAAATGITVSTADITRITADDVQTEDFIAALAELIDTALDQQQPRGRGALSHANQNPR
jgi:hypothetical protein